MIILINTHKNLTQLAKLNSTQKTWIFLSFKFKIKLKLDSTQNLELKTRIGLMSRCLTVDIVERLIVGCKKRFRLRKIDKSIHKWLRQKIHVWKVPGSIPAMDLIFVVTAY